MHILIGQKPVGCCFSKLVENCCYLQYCFIKAVVVYYTSKPIEHVVYCLHDAVNDLPRMHYQSSYITYDLTFGIADQTHIFKECCFCFS